MKIGLIGCGKQAPKHVSGLVQYNDVALVVADRDPERARALAAEKDLAWAESVSAVLDDPSVEAVSIATPSPTHVDLISRALDAGKHVFCEKPLCESPAEARSLKARADAAGRNLMVGFVYRFAPIFETAVEVLEAGALGTPVMASFRIGGRGSHQVWKHRKAEGGGAINEMMVHMLDMAIWFFGPMARADLLTCELLRPRRVIQGVEETVDAEDFVQARFRSAGGVEVAIEADLLTPAFSQHAEIQGDNGSFFGSITADKPCYVHCIEPAGGYPAGRTDISNPHTNLFLAQMAEFISAVRDGRPPRRCTAGDSVLLMDALNALLGPDNEAPACTT